MFAFLKRTFVVLHRPPADRRRSSGSRGRTSRSRIAGRSRPERARLIAIGVVIGVLGAVPAGQAAARVPRRAIGSWPRWRRARPQPGAGPPPAEVAEAARAVRRSGVGAQAAAAQAGAQPVRAAVVRDHRRAGIRQDDGAAQLGPEVSARAAGRQGRAARRRRHPQLRLVVHRRGGLPRHGRPLHDAGFRCRVGQRRAGASSSRCCGSTARAGRSTASSSRSTRTICCVGGRATREAHVDAARQPARGAALASCGIQLPVYLMVTKCDLVDGFAEYFDDLSAPKAARRCGA